MAAPAALALAKLFYPETEKSQTKAGDIKVPKGLETFTFFSVNLIVKK
jgi:pyrimidine nucleoside transport protein